MILSFKSRSIGNIKLDVTLEENHTSEMKISDNPIESGAVISDHCVLQPKLLVVKGIVVDYEPPFSELPLDNIPFNGALSRLNSVLPKVSIDLPPIARQAKQIYAEFKGINNALKTNVKELASFLPSFENDPNGIGTGGDRISEWHSKFLQLQRKAEPFDVVTGTRKYKNMVIQSVILTQSNQHVGEFTINLRELFLVDIASFNFSTSPISNSKNAVGSAKSNLAKETHKSVQPSPKKEKPTSYLKQIVQNWWGK